MVDAWTQTTPRAERERRNKERAAQAAAAAAAAGKDVAQGSTSA